MRDFWGLGRGGSRLKGERGEHFNLLMVPNLNLCIHPDFWPDLDNWSQAISVEVLPLNCSDSMLTDKPPVQSRHAIVIITIFAVIFISTFCNSKTEDIVKMVDSARMLIAHADKKRVLIFVQCF